jgi:four helix bundle protein
MTADELQDRRFAFAVNIVRFCRALPRTTDGYVLARQLLKAATSVGANYRAARRGRSRDEFISKLGVVVEEADETLYWLMLAVACDLISGDKGAPAIRESKELLAIFVRSRFTARERRKD